jgi:cytochrome oxidase Cu insertion factor (SCO1/SenC/PrrC family)
MNWKSFWSRACPAYFCLLAAAAPFHPRINQDHPNSLAARSRQVTELDENAIRKLVGIPGGRARPLLLYLWYTACQPCCAKLADVDKVYAEYHDRGLDVALVSIGPMDNKDSLSAYLEEHRVRAPAYLLTELDDELAEQILLKDWEVIVPSAFFYSRSGRVVAADTEAAAIEYSSLKRRVERLLSLGPG